MNKIQKPLTPQELAERLNLDVRTVRKYYTELGGVRLGPRKILFFEEEVIHAIQAQRKKQETMAGASQDQQQIRAGLVVRRLREGKRPVLLAKKCFCAFCARKMEERLRSLEVKVQVVINGWQTNLLRKAGVIPLIHYGMIGTNLFQEFDCAYCLTGYYVTEEAIDGILQDLLGSDMKIPLNISIEGRPCRRQAGVLNQKDRIYDLHTLAQHALDHLEMDTVLQAVGRVRPYTTPSEVITFQCADHPDILYTHEFTSIGEARDYFDIPSRRSTRKATLYTQVQSAKGQGLKQREAADLLGVGLRTIQRYWKSNPPPTLIDNSL